MGKQGIYLLKGLKRKITADCTFIDIRLNLITFLFLWSRAYVVHYALAN